MQSEFYLHKLYPLQDAVLIIVSELKSKFYLTGGTVVSRFMTNHRFSDDLDFFLNADPHFLDETKRIYTALYSVYKDQLELTLQSETFCRMMLDVEGIILKLDFVNDVAFHVGDFWGNEHYFRLDNPTNILSNKISALQRNAAKDISDILYLSFTHDFNWMQIIEDAQKKDTWVNEIEVATGLNQFDINTLETVKWTSKQDLSFFSQSLRTIAKEILMGADNSLKGTKQS